MAKGYQKNKERLEQVSLLGKALIRRAKKKCELCEAQGVSMSVVVSFISRLFSRLLNGIYKFIPKSKLQNSY